MNNNDLVFVIYWFKDRTRSLNTRYTLNNQTRSRGLMPLTDHCATLDAYTTVLKQFTTYYISLLYQSKSVIEVLVCP